MVDEWKALIDTRLKKHEYGQKVLAEQRRQDQSQYRSHLDEVKHVHEKQKYIDRMTC